MLDLIPSESFAVAHVEPREPWYRESREEAEALTNNLGDVKPLYIYGMGEGWVYNALVPWLRADSERRLIFLAEEVGVLRWILETERGQAMAVDPQVELHPLCPLEGNDGLFCWLANRYIMREPEVRWLSGYDGEEIADRIEGDAARARHMGAEYMEYGRPFYRNFWPNLRQLNKSYRADALFGRFKGIPAFVCGAGPSLEKQLGQLGELKDRALILAGGSALKSVDAHMGAAIDPNDEEYRILAKSNGFETPLFYRSRMQHEALELWHGPRLYVTGSGGYDTPQWVEERLGIEGVEVAEGYNVVTFLTDIARHLGCDPIIFVGVDLSGAEGDLRDYDIYQQPVYTTWEWRSAAEWIAAYASEHPEVQFLNATEGGLGFEGVENVRLKDLKWGKQRDIRGMMAGLEPLQVEGVEQLIKEMGESLARCEGLAEKSDFLSRFELEEEIAFEYLLKGVCSTHEKLVPGDDKARLAFLREAARVNREILEGKDG